MNKVAILLTTYNPGNYIYEQITSIKSQTWQDFKIYWGDDGSDQDQLIVIRKLLEPLCFEEFNFDRIGATGNFLSLLKLCTEEYIAFCDQDDVWEPQKIEIQVKALECYVEIPALSHSSVRILADGKKGKVVDICQNHSLTSLMGENCCRGCTVMINRIAKNKMVEIDWQDITWHDWLAITVVSCFGYIHKSETPLVQYRIHSNNTIGIPNYRNKAKNYLKREEGLIVSQFQLIRDKFLFELPDELKSDFSTYFTLFDGGIFKRMIKLLLDKKRRLSWKDDVVRRIAWSFKKP
jgi:glycosyltransferase involved in cell wall biosynthesis